MNAWASALSSVFSPSPSAVSEDSLPASGTGSALSGVEETSTSCPAEFASLVGAYSEALLSSAKADGAKQERQSMNASSNAVKRCLILYFCFINTSNKKSTCELQVLRLFCVILFLAEGIYPSTVFYPKVTVQ